MSTYCNNYKKDDCDCYDKKHDHYDKNKKKDCKVVSECKNLSGTGELTPPITNGTPTVKTLGSISVDLRCLCDPCVKIDVKTLIEFDPANAVTSNDEITLTFKLFKQCDNKNEVELETFDYFRAVGFIIADAVSSIDSFNFTICDCDGCPECCCTYRVEVEVTGTADSGIAARVLKGTISALAVSDCKCY